MLLNSRDIWPPPEGAASLLPFFLPEQDLQARERC